MDPETRPRSANRITGRSTATRAAANPLGRYPSNLGVSTCLCPAPSTPHDPRIPGLGALTPASCMPVPAVRTAYPCAAVLPAYVHFGYRLLGIPDSAGAFRQYAPAAGGGRCGRRAGTARDTESMIIYLQQKNGKPDNRQRHASSARRPARSAKASSAPRTSGARQARLRAWSVNSTMILASTSGSKYR